VRVKAATLNYRDLAVLSGKYLPDLPLPYVPASDACGEVVEVGKEVTRFKAGDRVVPAYTQGWHDGKPTPEQRLRRTLGGPLPAAYWQNTLSSQPKTRSPRRRLCRTSRPPRRFLGRLGRDSSDRVRNERA
jgi:hypothetical protein